jgi:hypothetical protein
MSHRCQIYVIMTKAKLKQVIQAVIAPAMVAGIAGTAEVTA